MTDLSALSDSQLQALYGHATASPDVSKMSDADLMAAYHGPSMLEDVGNSAGSGLANAAVGTVGGLGDLRSGLSSATDWAGGKLGVGSDKVQAFKNLASKAMGMTPVGSVINAAPTSEQIRQTFPDPLVPYDYKPQSLTGDVIQKAAEFAPNMLMGGPEGLLARFGTNVLAPAIGSVAGEKMGGPLGGVAGALVGGAGALSGARKFQEMAAARSASKALPTGEGLVENGSNLFNHARDMNVVVKPDFATKTAADMRNALKDFDPQDASVADVFRKIDRMENLGKPNAAALTPAQKLQAEMNWEPTPARPPQAPIEMNAVENIRKQLSELKTSSDAPTRTAAKKAQEVLTRNQMALTPADVISGDANAYSSTMRNAVSDYGAGKRAQTLAGKMNLAELNLNSPVGGLDMASHGQALQRTMKQLARPINNTNVPVARKLGFNNEEVSAITAAANGNKLTHLGDVANQVIPHWAGGGAAAAILRGMGGLSVKRQVSALDSLVRSRSALGAQVAAQLPPRVISQLPPKSQSLLQALALAHMNQQGSQPVSQSSGQQAR